ncbi:MAG: hypothetical protein KatS3mg020_0987 [Fimbriimonadales bacterium]|nr:MAG: hypothetical protein KatS3mg020_0987 [Fimbriimonadales bacterium]
MHGIFWRFGLLGLFLLALAGAPAQQVANGVVFHDRNRNGIRDAGEPGVPNVLVSNQREVVKTDVQGRYQLPVNDDTILFVVKPRGWMTPLSEDNVPRFYYIHKPNGSIRVQYGGAPPTGPLPASVDFPLYPQRESDRYRALMFGDTQPRDMTEVFYIGRDVVRELIGTKEAAFGVVLGDVLFDNLSLFPALTAMMGQIGVPIYYVLGNHDINFDSPDDQNSDETWHRYFGPNYYAFQWGRAHYIVLDDVVWSGAQGEQRGRYVAGLGERQIEFLRNYLSYVNRNDLIVLLMHIPMGEWPDAERRQVFELLAPFPNTLSYSAHTHVQMHRFFGAESGLERAQPPSSYQRGDGLRELVDGRARPSRHPAYDDARRHAERLSVDGCEPQPLSRALPSRTPPRRLPNAHLHPRRSRTRSTARDACAGELLLRLGALHSGDACGRRRLDPHAAGHRHA